MEKYEEGMFLRSNRRRYGCIRRIYCMISPMMGLSLADCTAIYTIKEIM